MNKKFLSLFAAALSLGFVACNNDGDGTAESDTTTVTTENTATTINTTNDYTAMADTFQMGNTEGRYLDARTGKAIKISVDPQTGTRTNAETGEPVWRYIDNRTWWVYGGDNWDTLGEAKMDNGKVVYKGDNDSWVTYENRWPEDEKMEKEWKKKVGDTKIKVSKDGDVKIKDEDGKVKYDADDNKIKTDSSK